MSLTEHRSRQPKGIATGGQFAAEAKCEDTTVQLSPQSAPPNEGWVEGDLLEDKVHAVLNGPLSRGVANGTRVAALREALRTVEQKFPGPTGKAYRQGLAFGVNVLTDRRLGTEAGMDQEFNPEDTHYRAELLNTKRTSHADREAWRVRTHYALDPDFHRGSLDAGLLLSGEKPVGPSGSVTTDSGMVHTTGPRYTAYAAGERATILGQLADGNTPEVVFGPERPQAAATLHAWISGIAPTPEHRIQAAYGAISGRHIKAYDAGRKFLAEAYSGYTDELPDTVSPGRRIVIRTHEGHEPDIQP